ncbi:hypothetical protein EMIHUDRAFT_103494 [Emiliania huxleyi CCMP1516]|uniref:SET domain-containing protein n=2 Tax=Emiliania huxleyi TaxID=2903 RepID=A0A0D3IT46_EMIH1|nr:hypothetical protein EMIHUDRAFT_103494 [Emiliania huxleyi CCMP1516]EOD14431.1 hypothetical protein EMIHUDRAFT_103494 [Emiliania huxleyi CCMP1516]|eukprot:XP_005766860.1 hypothetical protein EMIHUDRAFT_103494 [Emiliania huxleyi CCMP1516]
MSRVHYDSAARQLAWLGQHARLAGVKLSAVSPAGSGLAAARDLAAGDVALSVPPQAWRPFSAAAAREAAGNAVATRTDAFAASLGAGAALADAALLALALAAQRRSESSPYVSALPVGSCAYRWAQAVLLSRAHSGDGKPLALVPGIDLVNHAGAARCGGRCGGRGGEPLLIDYGLRASHKLLRLYGFLAPRDEEPTVTGGEAGGGGSGVGGEGGGGGGGGGGGVGGVSGAPPPEADEVVVPLLPSVAEMGGDADESARQIEEARAALAACGLRGSSVRLGVSPDGSVLLPALASTAPSAAAAAARHVFRTALEAQRERQREGSAACLAVEGMAEMDEAGNAAARGRARLCLRLHEREGAAVEEAIAELERTAS